MSARAEQPPRHLMSRKNESVAWRAFVKLGGNKVVCRICAKQMNYQSGSSTSNMVKHLQAVHRHILADAAASLRCPKYISATNETDEPTAIPSTEPWMVLQHAPAHLRQRWQDLKLGLQKEMLQHQQAVAWSAIGTPCLGAPAGADLLTDSHANPSPPCWGTSNNNSNSSSSCLSNNSTSAPPADSSPAEGTDWQRGKDEDSCDPVYRYPVKTEPVETEDITDRCDSSSPPPEVLSPPSPASVEQLPSTAAVSVLTCAPGSGGNSMPPPPEPHDGPAPRKNMRHSSSQTCVPCTQHCLNSSELELELRLSGLRRAQQRAEELHHEHLRESRARADAAQAERDHRLQLIRHAEEMHQQALERNRQLHEMTLRKASKSCEQQ